MIQAQGFVCFFLVFSVAEFLSLSQWNLGAFLPNSEKNPNLNYFFFFFFLKGWDFHSHTSYMVTFSFTLMVIVCRAVTIYRFIGILRY